jgi:hypothetical protein
MSWIVWEPSTTKTCSRCQQTLQLSNFGARSLSSDGLTAHCRSCARDIRLRYLYNITLDDYNHLKERQNGRCAMCDRHETELDRVLEVDHDHACCSRKRACGKCVRGLLCDYCNNYLKSYEDSTRRGATDAYLAKYRMAVS